MKTAIPYIRFSSGKQTYGRSEARQQEKVAKWLKDHPDYELSPLTFKDLGRSGYHGKHLEHELGKLLAAIKEGLVQKDAVVLVEAVDRIGRLEPLTMLGIFGDIVKEGLTIITLDDGVSYDRTSINNNHLFLLAAKVQQAWLHSDRLSDKISDAWNAKRKKAKEGIPIKRRMPLWFNSDGTINEELRPLIVKAFEDCAAGLGNAAILRRLRQLNPIFNDYSVPGVRNWFESRLPIGEWNDVQCFPAVVSKELYYRALQTRELNKRGKRLKTPYKHHLSGLVFCGVCGHQYNYAGHGTDKKPQAPHLKCGALQSLKCSNKKRIALSVLDAIRVLTFQPYLEQALSNQKLNKNKKEIIELEHDLTIVSNRIAALTQTLSQTGFIQEIVEELKTLKGKRGAMEEKKRLLEASPVVLDSEVEDAWKSLSGALNDLSTFKAASDLERMQSWGKVKGLLEAEKDLMLLNSLLRHVDYKMFVSPSTDTTCNIDVRVGEEVFRYRNWIKAINSYIVIKPNGTEIEVPSDLRNKIALKLLGH